MGGQFTKTCQRISQWSASPLKAGQAGKIPAREKTVRLLAKNDDNYYIRDNRGGF
jgi:hypothetical protein